MLAAEKWAEGKHQTIAAFCFMIALGIDEFEEIFQQIKNPNSFPMFPIPRLQTWLSYYRHRLAIFSFLKQITEEYSAIGQVGVQYGESLILGAKQIDILGRDNVIEMLNRLPDGQRSEFEKKLTNTKQDFFKNTLADYQADINNSGASPNLPLPPIATFFFLVHFPCILIYRETPSSLYQKAKSGDLEALEKLLRLDPALLHDRHIANVLFSLREKRKFTIYDSLLRACHKNPKAKLTTAKFKVAIAGFISFFTNALGKPLTAPQIRQLFDAVAFDSSQGELISDPDLPESDETFYKAIQRERELWQATLPNHPDKK